MSEPNYAKASLVYQLLKDYHAITPDLKALRAGSLLPEQAEAARSRATGWFNQVFLLWMAQLIDLSVLRWVATRAGATLYLAHVAPLDAAIRNARAQADGRDEVPLGEHPVERFWAEYAEGRIQVPPSA